MDNRKKIVLAVMILPWLSFPFLGKKTIKRFSLTSLFICLVFGAQSLIAHKRGWWRVYPRLVPNVISEFPFMAGPFFIGAMWILKFTYGKFLRFVMVNLAVDFFHIYIFVTWLKNRGIASLIRLKHSHAYILFTLNALLMYAFQIIVEKRRERKRPRSLMKKLFS